ncbi:MAG: radical SAM protein [Bacteroidales bacterium]|nr:radical SAM protein [Bacteroidales bacterium]
MVSTDNTPAQLNFITTNRCNAACSHCIMCSGNKRKETLTYAQIKKDIDRMYRLRGSSFAVIFTGGEPTLLGEDLLEAIAYADSLDVTTRIITNAHWARTPELAKSKLQELAECGLCEINISTDDYHAKYIPFEYVKNAWFAAKGMGFNSVIIGCCYSDDSTITPDYIESQFGEKLQHRFESPGKEAKLDKRSEDGTIYAMSNTHVQKLGRASKELDDSSFYFNEDRSAFYGKCPTIMKTATVSPGNHLWGCCGFECGDGGLLDMGDLSKYSLNALIKKSEKSLIVASLKTFGPMFLVDFVESKDPTVRFKERYSCVCAICEDLLRNEKAIQVINANRKELWDTIKASNLLTAS